MSVTIGGRQFETWQVTTLAFLSFAALVYVLQAVGGTSGAPTAPGTIWDPFPDQPPQPHPLPGEDGQLLPGEQRPPLDEPEKKPH